MKYQIKSQHRVWQIQNTIISQEKDSYHYYSPLNGFYLGGVYKLTFPLSLYFYQLPSLPPSSHTHPLLQSWLLLTKFIVYESMPGHRSKGRHQAQVGQQEQLFLGMKWLVFFNGAAHRSRENQGIKRGKRKWTGHEKEIEESVLYGFCTSDSS